MFYKKIHDTNNRWTLMKLEKQIDEYLEKYEEQLEDEMVEDILDIRDTIITRLSQLRREEMMMTYLETPLPKIIIPTIEEQEPKPKPKPKPKPILQGFVTKEEPIRSRVTKNKQRARESYTNNTIIK